MTHRRRAIEPGDLDRLARLHAQCFPEDPWDARAFAELLAMPGASGHLIENSKENQPLGVLLDIVAADEAEILTLGVAPAARRQGIAQALLDDLVERARQAGVRSLGLEVAADNRAARRLYERCRFSAVGERRDYYRRGNTSVDALIFRRALLR